MKKLLSLVAFVMISNMSYAQSVSLLGYSTKVPHSWCGINLSCTSTKGERIEITNLPTINNSTAQITNEQIRDAKCANGKNVHVSGCGPEGWGSCPAFKYKESDKTIFSYTLVSTDVTATCK